MYSSTTLPGWIDNALTKLRKFVSYEDIYTRRIKSFFNRPTNTTVAFITDVISDLSREDIAELIFWIMVDPNTVYSLLDLQEQNEELQGEVNELKKLVSILQSNLEIIREYTRYENYG